MNSIIGVFLIINLLVSAQEQVSKEKLLFQVNNDNNQDYCNICKDHTMCQDWLPWEVYTKNCWRLMSTKLDNEEIEWIVQKHNKLREKIIFDLKNNNESSLFMMQLFWDEELATIAERWAQMCERSEKDKCRDVKRFSVLQNVNMIFLLEIINTSYPSFEFSTIKMLSNHLQCWYKRSGFKKHGKVEISEGNGLYDPFVSKIGCGRSTYETNKRSSLYGVITSDIPQYETLVCNYGPFTSKNNKNLTESFGCKTHSRNYPELCLELENKFQQNLQQNDQKDLKADDTPWWRWLYSNEKVANKTVAASSATSFFNCACCTLFLLLLLLTSSLLMIN